MMLVSLVTGSSETSPFGDMVQPAWLSHSQIGEACTGETNRTSKINANSITNQIDQKRLCIGSDYYHIENFTRISTFAIQRSQSG